MRFPAFVSAILLSLLLAACGGVSYPDEKLVESLEKILLEEYSIDDVKVTRKGTSLWMHVPVERIYGQNYSLAEEAMEKIQNVSFSATRVFMSSDADIEFLALYAFAEGGMELRMVRHTQDIEKARMWYMSREDLEQRSDISRGFNPVVYGQRALRNLKGAGSGEIKENIVSEKQQELVEKIPPFGEIKEMKSIRKSDNEALIYARTDGEKDRALFLVSAEFSEIFKDLMFLLQSAERDDEEQDPFEEIPLPIIAGYWDIESGMPREYEHFGPPEDWAQESVYSRAVNFKNFIAEQIERRIRVKFEDKAGDWAAEITELEVLFPGNTLVVTGRAQRGDEALYEVDPEHEMLLTVVRAVKDYEIDIDKVVFRRSLWDDERVIPGEELSDIKPKRWRRIRQPGEMYLAEKIVSLLMPAHATESAE